MSTAEATRASLPLAAVLADLREQLAAANGQEARNLRLDIRWALIDACREIQADAQARALAEELAHAGEEDAAAALTLAHKLRPLPPPSGAIRGNFGSSFVFTGSAVPARLVELLAEHRADGLGFGVAWTLALTELRADRGPGRAILEATRAAWRSAYYRTNAPAGYGLARWGEGD